MASTTLPEGTLGRVITRDNAQEGLYKYNIGERVVTVESKSNIEKGQLKNFPNHNIGIRKHPNNVIIGDDFRITGNAVDCIISNLDIDNPFKTGYSALSKSHFMDKCNIISCMINGIPFQAENVSLYSTHNYLQSYDYTFNKNSMLMDASRLTSSIVYGDFYIPTEESIKVPTNTTSSATVFVGATYVGELNVGETIRDVINRMTSENKRLYHGSEGGSGLPYFPEYLPFILIATNKKVDLSSVDNVTFESFVQIPNAVFEEPSMITNTWTILQGFPSEVSLSTENISYISYDRLKNKADTINNKIYLYGLMLTRHRTAGGNSFTKLDNYIQFVGRGDYTCQAKSNTTRIGSSQTTDTYLKGTVHSNGSFVTDSDERIKRKDKLVTTRADGIEVWKFTYHSNGKTELGWIAQQVEEVLRAKSYEQDVIDLAITTASGVDYNASLSKLNAAMGSSYDLFSDAEKAHAEWLYGKFTEAGGSEPTLDAFREAIEKIPYESLTEWQKSTIQMLDENSLGSFLVWANDIKSINKQVVLDLLQGV